MFVEVRKKCSEILTENNLVEDGDEWKGFSYTPLDYKYEGSEAIATIVYKTFIDSLHLSEKHEKYYKEKSELALKGESLP